MGDERMTLEEKVKRSPAVWFLTTLLSGFLAGIAAYKFAIDNRNDISDIKQRYERLQTAEIEARQRVVELEKILKDKENEGKQARSRLEETLKAKNAEIVGLQSGRKKEPDAGKWVQATGYDCKATCSDSGGLRPLISGISQDNRSYYVCAASVSGGGQWRTGFNWPNDVDCKVFSGGATEGGEKAAIYKCYCL